MLEFPSLSLAAPDGSIIGVIEEGGGPQLPRDGASDSLLEYPFATADALARLRGISRLAELRRSGATLVVISHDEALLHECADEIWWLRDGKLIARGHPAEVLPLYRQHVSAAFRASGEGVVAALQPTSRNGDHRAVLECVELLGENGQPSTVWRSGEAVAIKVRVRYAAKVENSVIGVLIRTRVGLNVYGTNTELEQLSPGPVSAGDLLTVTYRFRCDLCPGDYTVTAASHDSDGVWHDWVEDAVAFAVTDARYTAGVANLRAQVMAELSRP